MARKEIVWSQHASKELRNTLQYFNQTNKSNLYSIRLVNELEDLLASLQENELLGKITDDHKSRVLIFRKYSIFYQVHKSRIKILSFWDNRRNPAERTV